MLHWTRDIDAVLAGVSRALRPGGRFVGEFGGAGNIATFLPAVESALRTRGLPFKQPWYFPTEADFSAALHRAGLAVDRVERFPRPTPLPAGIVGWIETFGGPLLAHVPIAERQDVGVEVEAALAPTHRQHDGTWVMDYVRLRFKATLA
jgi:hypothetical protein